MRTGWLGRLLTAAGLAAALLPGGGGRGPARRYGLPNLRG